jgi:hypothetical protein
MTLDRNLIYLNLIKSKIPTHVILNNLNNLRSIQLHP